MFECSTIRPSTTKYRMTTALLSWLSKSSSLSTDRFIIFIVVVVTIFVIDAIPIVIDTVIWPAVGIIYWARFFARTASQLATNTGCSSPITIINLIHSIFHVVRLGIKRGGFSSQSIRGCTMMKARIYCFLCMKAVKKSTLITSRCAEKASIQERCQSSLRE